MFLSRVLRQYCLERFVIGSVTVRVFLLRVLQQYCLERFVIGSVAVCVFLSAVLQQYCVEHLPVSSACPVLFLVAIYHACSDCETPISGSFTQLFVLCGVLLSELDDVVSAQESHVVFWLFINLGQLQVVLAVVLAFLMPAKLGDFVFLLVVFFIVLLPVLLKMRIKSSGIPHNLAYL